MVVEALWNRVFEIALTSTIVSDLFMPRDHSRVGALRFALFVRLSVRPFVTLYSIEFA